MPKTRKLGSSDHLLGTTAYGHVLGTDHTNLAEADVWLTSSSNWTEPDHTNPNQSNRARAHWARTDTHRHVGGLSLAFEDRCSPGSAMIHHYRNVESPSKQHVAMAASAPINIPVWSKMVRVDSVDSMNGSGSLELDGRDESERVPPHEYLAREHGKTVTTSVFEGVGRTLKGRDMSRVRDAVWSKTGFFG